MSLGVPVRLFDDTTYYLGSLPKSFKDAIVVMVYKKGDKTLADNYQFEIAS